MAQLDSVSRTPRLVSSGGVLSYPSDLGNTTRTDHYVMFFINVTQPQNVLFPGGSVATSSAGVAQEANTLQVQRAPTRRLDTSIALYMPSQIQMSHKANYGEQEIGAAVATVLAGLRGSNSNMGFGEVAGKIAAEAGKEIAKGGMAALDATLAPGAIAAEEIASGKVRNNRSEMKFEGIDRRSFSFTFTMLPTSSQEADTIEKIVTLFRYHAMPSIDGSDLAGRTMIAPSTFDIQYKPDAHLHRISTSVLESVDVKYGGERPQFFVDDHPVETELTLQFKELEIITKERIEQGY